MYDNVDLKISVCDVGNIALLEEIPAILTGISQTEFENGNISVTGYLDTMKISLNEKSLKVKDSSICKWYLGDNFQVMTRGDMRRAIEKLSDALHLPMEKAVVTRIDVAQNFIMRHEKQVYFDHLGNLQHFNRMPQKNGLYYSNSTKTLLFYEKVCEQKAKNKPIPELFTSRNVMRYENRFKSRLLQEFNRPEIKAVMLYEDRFYTELVTRWRQSYEKIKKINDIQLNYSMVKTKKDQNRQALLYYVSQRGGELNVIKEIKEAQKRGDLTKKQAYDLREQVEEACKAALFTYSSDVIQELDKKVKEAARFCL